MIKNNKTSMNEVKEKLQALSKNELSTLIIEISRICPKARNLLVTKFSTQDNVKKVLEDYKQIVKNEFYPKRGHGKLRLKVAKQAISDFKKISDDKSMIIDIMLYYVENCVQFTREYGDIYESFYLSAESTFQNAVKMINTGDQALYEMFSSRLEWIVKKAVDGWGFKDTMMDIYHDLKFSK